MVKNKRLIEIVNNLDKTHTLLDIGTDHGLLIKEAFLQDKISFAVASDINELPLNNAKENLTGYPVKFVLSNGFLNISDKFDVVVIAGMGSNTIIDILSQKHESDNVVYLLQANDRHYLLRKYLMDNNFKIIDENVVYDKKHFYVIMKVIKGTMYLSNDDLHVGPILKTKKESSAYFKHRYTYLQSLIVNNSLVSGEIFDAYNAYSKIIK